MPSRPWRQIVCATLSSITSGSPPRCAAQQRRKHTSGGAWPRQVRLGSWATVPTTLAALPVQPTTYCTAQVGRGVQSGCAFQLLGMPAGPRRSHQNFLARGSSVHKSRAHIDRIDFTLLVSIPRCRVHPNRPSPYRPRSTRTLGDARRARTTPSPLRCGPTRQGSTADSPEIVGS